MRLLAAGGSGVATLGLPGTAGVPASAVANTLVVPYNVVPQLDEQVAAVIVEPVAANMGVVAPAPGFLAGPARRVRPCRCAAGLRRSDHRLPARPRRGPGEIRRDADLTTFGKVIGGGLPIGSVGGRRRDHGDAVAARPGVPRRHAGRQPAGNGRGSRGTERARRRRVRRAHRPRRPAVVAAGRGVRRCRHRRDSSPWSARWSACTSATATPPTNFAEAKTTDERVYRTFFHAMLHEGIALAPGAYEALFVGLAHTDDVLDAIAEAAGRAATATASQLG